MGAAERSKPEHGGACPICGNGVLYLIAETPAGVYLRCFNCDTAGTVPHEGEWQAAVDPATQTPTGFQVTRDQLAAQQAATDPEQAQYRSRMHIDQPAPAAAAGEQPPTQPDGTPVGEGE